MNRFISTLGILLFVVAVAIAQSNTHPAYFSGCDNLVDSSLEKHNCSNEAIMLYLAENVQYPEVAQREGIKGTVYVSFIVSTDGSITQANILRDIGAGCGQEALRVIERMPKWAPAYDSGKPIATKLNLPVHFSLHSDQAIANNYSITWGVLKGNRCTREDIREAIGQPLYVRDETGNLLQMNELTFTHERAGKYKEARSNGLVTRQMQKLIKKLRKGDFFTITSTVQKNGKFIFVERAFLID